MASTVAGFVKELGEDNVLKILSGHVEKVAKKKERKAEEAALKEEFRAFKAAKAAKGK